MNPMYLLSILAIGISSAWAGNGWLCEEEASQRVGNTFKACGIGTGRDENAARLGAFDNARKEFIRVCSISDDCSGHKVNVHPQRTACEQKNRSYICHRLVVFEIGEVGSVSGRSGSSPGRANTRSVSSKEIRLREPNEIFEPFTYQQVANLPKVAKGMPKAEVLRSFGKPRSANTHFGQLMFSYEGKMCDGQDCYVHFDDDGRVSSFSRFKAEFTDLLK